MVVASAWRRRPDPEDDRNAKRFSELPQRAVNAGTDTFVHSIADENHGIGFWADMRGAYGKITLFGGPRLSLCMRRLAAVFNVPPPESFIFLDDDARPCPRTSVNILDSLNSDGKRYGAMKLVHI